jgi:mono/diheme cytochrome c family protein
VPLLRRVLRPAVGLAAVLLGGAGLIWVAGPQVSWADQALVDPLLGQPTAIDAGEQIYREKCIICHGKAGGRGPDLFAVALTDEEFLNTVLNGRPGTLMPAFGSRLSRDDVWKVRAFVKAHPNGI